MAKSSTKPRNAKEAPAPVPETPQGPLPMTTRALLALAVLVGFLYALRIWLIPIKSWDLWFHMTAGEWIVTHHQVPSHDPFSWTAQGKPWMVNAWISDIVLWATYHFGGPAGTTLFQIALAFFVFGVIGFGVYRLSGNPVLAVALPYLSLIGSYHRFNIRPELFTLALLVILVTILYQYKFRIADRVWWLVPMGVLWSNLHMGFTVAVLVLGCFLAGDGILSIWYASRHKPIPDEVISGPRLKRLAIAGGLMLLGTIVNPYGPGAWLFMTKVSPLFSLIGEWQPFFRYAIQYGPLAWTLVLFALVLIALAFSRRPQDFVGLLLTAALAASAVRFSRQAAQFSLVAPFVIAAALRGLRAPKPLRLPAAAGAGALLALELVVFVVLLAWRLPMDVGADRMGFGLDRTRCSPRAMEFLRESGLMEGNAKLFNTMEAGGWLLWNLWPEQKVFIDGRLDMYGFDADYDYLRMSASPEMGKELADLGIAYCYFHCPNNTETGVESALYNLLPDQNWALVYFDDAGLIFARREPRNEAIISRYEFRILNPLTVSELDGQSLDSGRVLREVAQVEREAPDSAWGRLTAGVALELIGRARESRENLLLARRQALRWDPRAQGCLADFLGRASMDLKDPRAAAGYFGEAIDSAQKAEAPPALLAVLRQRRAQALQAASGSAGNEVAE